MKTLNGLAVIAAMASAVSTLMLATPAPAEAQFRGPTAGQCSLSVDRYGTMGILRAYANGATEGSWSLWSSQAGARGSSVATQGGPISGRAPGEALLTNVLLRNAFAPSPGMTLNAHMGYEAEESPIHAARQSRRNAAAGLPFAAELVVRDRRGNVICQTRQIALRG